MAQANPTPTPTPTRDPLTMEPALRPLDPDAKPISISNSNIINSSKTHPLPLPNGGGIKRPPPLPLPLPLPLPPQQLRLPAQPDSLYRECLKNHAATLGGHALDGCGEFMPSPTATPADPTSLKCAACSCHRNFHRRLPQPRDDETDDGDDGDDDERRRQSSSSPPPYFSSAPHMLLALSTGIANPAAAARPGGPPGTRKRFRTRFSPEQKERMQELSERLGWRMQKRDEGMVEESCREIGVRKGVFKVWMHNNKHNFVPGSSRRGEIIGGGAAAAAAGIMTAAAAAAGAGIEGNGIVGGNGVVVNGSSSSS